MVAAMLGAGLLLGAWSVARAAAFCVNTPLAFAIALSLAQDNGEDDVIDVEVGDYLLGGELDYLATPTETHGLYIYGGWGPNCLAHAGSGSSVLDGQNSVRVLYVAAQGDVSISGLTFQHANAANYAGGALNLTGPAGALLAVDYNVFVDDHAASNQAGAVHMQSAGTMEFRNNLVVANSGTESVLIGSDGIADVNNNTVVGNQLAAHAGLGALVLSGSGASYVANNILWGNEGNDVYEQSANVYFYNNDVGARDGFAPAGDSNGLSVDPQFNGILSVKPGPKSPLVNAGFDTPYGGFGNVDLAGTQRLIGKHVDIGAYESDVLFRSGFEL
jgi:hypothetical protein